MADSRAHLTTIPSEIRRLIFEHVFADCNLWLTYEERGKYNWTTWPYLEEHFPELRILSICKAIYEDARSGLASSITPCFDEVSPTQVQASVREYYYPRIRHLEIIFEKYTFSAADFAPFRALKQLKFTKSEYTTSIHFLLLPDTKQEKVAMKCLDGGLDEKLKKMAKRHYLESPKSRWVRELLLDEERSYKMLTFLEACWSGDTGPEGRLGFPPVLVRLAISPSRVQ